MKKSAFFLLIMIVAGCGNPDIQPGMLDGDQIFDPSLNDPSQFLLSVNKPNPNASEAATPVLIMSHGYTATTFEWQEFKDWANINYPTDFFTSQILLGGHGSSYEEFKESSWEDWKVAITDEYETLVEAGYTRISFVGSSTSCALILELIEAGYFSNTLPPENIFFVDPIVLPSSKILSIVGLIGPMLGYIEADNTTEEDQYWYHFRPEKTLRELNKLLRIVRKDLQNGITLPEGTRLKVFKSLKDPTADPVSAVLLYKGIRTSGGELIEVEMIESDLHVYTRLNLRTDVSAKDQANQNSTFQEIATRLGQ